MATDVLHPWHPNGSKAPLLWQALRLLWARGIGYLCVKITALGAVYCEGIFVCGPHLSDIHRSGTHTALPPFPATLPSPHPSPSWILLSKAIPTFQQLTDRWNRAKMTIERSTRNRKLVVTSSTGNHTPTIGWFYGQQWSHDCLLHGFLIQDWLSLDNSNYLQTLWQLPVRHAPSKLHGPFLWKYFK